MDTPPGTTLSTPSPTELFDKDPITAENERSEMISSKLQNLQPVYLVVATTTCAIKYSSSKPIRRLGIGLNGKLPWPNIKADMAYFKGVTETATADGLSRSEESVLTNTVIMGRKTYFSIPQKFRPLARRKNIIITRSAITEVVQNVLHDLEISRQQAQEWITKKWGTDIKEHQYQLEISDPKSITRRYWLLSEADFTQSALSEDETQIEAVNGAIAGVVVARSPRTAIAHARATGSGEVFCIGGAEVYNAFLNDHELRPSLRLLQTEIENFKDDGNFECDTFWPEDVLDGPNKWEEVSKAEIVRWTGVEVPQAQQDWLEDAKAGVKLRVKGWKYKPS